MKGRGGRGGFSLVEVLIALAVMSLALMALVSVLVSAMQAQGKTDTFSTAHGVADQVHERLAVSLQSLEPSQANQFWRAASGESWSLTSPATVSVNGVDFTTSITSSPILSDSVPLGTQGGDASNVARMVTVRVRWSEDSHKVGQGQQEISTLRLLSRSEG